MHVSQAFYQLSYNLSHKTFYFFSDVSHPLRALGRISCFSSIGSNLKMPTPGLQFLTHMPSLPFPLLNPGGLTGLWISSLSLRSGNAPNLRDTEKVGLPPRAGPAVNMSG